MAWLTEILRPRGNCAAGAGAVGRTGVFLKAWSARGLRGYGRECLCELSWGERKS